MDVQKQHRSHIGQKRSRARGWTRVPPLSVREKTRRLGSVRGY